MAVCAAFGRAARRIHRGCQHAGSLPRRSQPSSGLSDLCIRGGTPRSSLCSGAFFPYYGGVLYARSLASCKALETYVFFRAVLRARRFRTRRSCRRLAPAKARPAQFGAAAPQDLFQCSLSRTRTQQVGEIGSESHPGCSTVTRSDRKPRSLLVPIDAKRWRPSTLGIKFSILGGAPGESRAAARAPRYRRGARAAPEA